MKHLKLFESKADWREDGLRIYDLFCELSDKSICSIDIQVGYMTSNNCFSYPCFIKDGELHGNDNTIDHMINVNSKLVIRAVVEPNYKHARSPFHMSYASSIFSDDLSVFFEIMKSAESLKGRLGEYDTDITIREKTIYINFLKK